MVARISRCKPDGKLVLMTNILKKFHLQTHQLVQRCADLQSNNKLIHGIVRMFLSDVVGVSASGRVVNLVTTLTTLL